MPLRSASASLSWRIRHLQPEPFGGKWLDHHGSSYRRTVPAEAELRPLLNALPADRRGLWSEEAADLCARAGEMVRDGDVVFVKGSKGSRVASVVDAIRRARQTPASDNNKG